VTTLQRKAAELEARQAGSTLTGARQYQRRRKQVQHDFGTVARALAAGSAEDKQLALDVVQFVQQMPPVKSRHAEQVEALQRAAVHKKRAERAPERDKPERKDQGRSR